MAPLRERTREANKVNRVNQKVSGKIVSELVFVGTSRPPCRLMADEAVYGDGSFAPVPEEHKVVYKGVESTRASVW